MSDANPPAAKPARATVSSYVQNTILVGVLTAAPLVVTWFILQFLFSLTAAAGRPMIQLVGEAVGAIYPGLQHLLLRPSIEDALAVLIVIAALFLLGVFTRNVIGRSVLSIINRLMDRIPFANKLYGGLRQLVEMLQRSPDGAQRIVLVEFPSENVRAVGIVTRTMRDKATGEELAAVYVPTTPNPTNGYLEVVPLARLVPLDMTMDDAMSFIISGGAVGPDVFAYSRSKGAQRPAPAAEPG